jgi:predicted PhzF superfamily epimerase YddE/YHI9
MQVDSFSALPFGGNPAVVVLEARGLAEDELPRVAAELRAPGTAFVFRRTSWALTAESVSSRPRAR